jgi:hypothetical protein
MAQGRFKDVLKNGGFVAFLWTQFLGAFNDNAYRIIVSRRAVHIVAQADQNGKYLALAGAIVLPSLLFTGYAGQTGGRHQQAQAPGDPSHMPAPADLNTPKDSGLPS